MIVKPLPEEKDEIPDNASLRGIVETTNEESPGKAKPRTARAVDIVGIAVGIFGTVIGLAEIAVSLKVRMNPTTRFRLVYIGYAVSLLSVLTFIWISANKWIRLGFALIVLLVSLSFPMFIRSLEANLSQDESEYGFEQDSQEWTADTFRFGVLLGDEPFASTECAFAGRQSLAFDISLWGVDKAEPVGTGQLRLPGYPPPSGSTLIAHVYLPSNAPENVLAQFRLMLQGEEVTASAPMSLRSGKWTSVHWLLPKEASTRNVELALQFYLGWQSAPVGKVQSQWKGRIFIDSVDVLPPASAAHIMPTPVLSPLPTSTVIPASTAISTPTGTAALTTTRESVYPTPPELEPAPSLASPRDGSVFRDAESVRLEWSWTGPLEPRGFFVVRVWPTDQPGISYSIHWEPELSYYQLDISRFEPGGYKWNVAVVHLTQEGPFWEQVSHNSSDWTFAVQPDSAEVVVALGDVLLVDDDRNSEDMRIPPPLDCSANYVSSLSNLGGSFTYWDTLVDGTPTQADMERASAVIWFTCRDFRSNLNSLSTIEGTEATELQNYLEDGGRLFITGQEIAYCSDPSFVASLGASLCQSSIFNIAEIPTPSVGGAFNPSAEPIAGGMGFDIARHGDGTGFPFFVDELKLTGDASLPVLFALPPNNARCSGIVGVKNASEPTLEAPQEYLGRSVYLSFDFDDINNDTGFNKREELLENILDWLQDDMLVVIRCGKDGQTVDCDAELSSSVGATATEFRWDLGDGTILATGPVESVVHNYSAPGTYAIQVEVTDCWGHKALGALTITVQ